MNVPRITPIELKQALESAAPPVVIDVREDEELEISALNGAKHIPVHEIPSRMNELDPNEDLVIICRSGHRSAQVTAYLMGQGFSRVRNLTTGINGWATDVDRSLPIY